MESVEIFMDNQTRLGIMVEERSHIFIYTLITPFMCIYDFK